MNTFAGHPVIYWTIKKILDNFENASIVIAAPKFDEKGELKKIAESFPGKVNIFYAYDANPTQRLIATHKRFLKDDFFIRIDGLHMFFVPKEVINIYRMAVKDDLDCCKFPDDYPVQLTVDVYKASSLKIAAKYINKNSPYIVHPKYYMFNNKKFKTSFFRTIRNVTNQYLSQSRHVAEEIYYIPRLEVNKLRAKVGDQLTFHYQLAKQYLKSSDVLLDIACGNGYGLHELSKSVKEAHGADLSPAIIREAKEKYKAKNVKFHVGDATKMPFSDDFFDVITSFETIEHVDPLMYLKEIKRALKPGGRMIFSTPQNSLGHIPINAEHNHEYSLEEIRKLISKYFNIQKIIGIKQGCIIHKGNNKGNNTFMVCKNNK
jgi:SAM-dependent methyltransferase